MPVGVHLAVVDPGVGSSRRPLALRTADGQAALCEQARVSERLAAAQKTREQALKDLRLKRPKVARALLQLAAVRDPSSSVRQVAAAELEGLR